MGFRAVCDFDGSVSETDNKSLDDCRRAASWMCNQSQIIRSAIIRDFETNGPLKKTVMDAIAEDIRNNGIFWRILKNERL